MSGYQPAFDIDRAYGEAGEGTLREILKLSGGGHFEVKRKRRHDDMFYVELEQSPGATGTYKPSGLNLTEAIFWAYVIGSTGVVVLIPTARLAAACRTIGHRAEETDGDNPTRGRLLSFVDILAADIAKRVAA
jgi:hypothetical protein